MTIIRKQGFTLKRGLINVKHGFTLIEILLVILIIGIVLAIATVSFMNAQQKGRDGARKADLKALQQALEVFYAANKKYPSSSTGKLLCPGSTTPMEWGTPFRCGSTTYMEKLPTSLAGLEISAVSNFLAQFNFSYDVQAQISVPVVGFVGGGVTLEYAYDSPSEFTYVIYATMENSKDPEVLATQPCSTLLAGYNYCVVNP